MEEEYHDTDVEIKDVPEYDQMYVEPVIKREEIEIRTPNYPVKEKGVPDFNSKILQKHFCTLIVGRPESGKSHLLYEFLNNPDMYHKKFNRIIFVTKNQKIGGINLKEQPYWINEFDLQKIDQTIEDFNKTTRAKYPDDESLQQVYGKSKDPFNVLLVIDDFIAYFKYKGNQNSKILESLFYNRRWVIERGCLSILITSQYYVDLPRNFRCNLTSIILFNCNQDDWTKIQKECMQKTKAIAEQDQKIINEIFSTPQAFLYINIELSKLYYRFTEELDSVNYKEPQMKKRILN